MDMEPCEDGFIDLGVLAMAPPAAVATEEPSVVLLVENRSVSTRPAFDEDGFPMLDAFATESTPTVTYRRFDASDLNENSSWMVSRALTLASEMLAELDVDVSDAGEEVSLLDLLDESMGCTASSVDVSATDSIVEGSVTAAGGTDTEEPAFTSLQPAPAVPPLPSFEDILQAADAVEMQYNFDAILDPSVFFRRAEVGHSLPDEAALPFSVEFSRSLLEGARAALDSL